MRRTIRLLVELACLCSFSCARGDNVKFALGPRRAVDDETLSAIVKDAVEYSLRRLRCFQEDGPTPECTERAVWILQRESGGGTLHVSNGEYTYVTAGSETPEKSGFTNTPATLAPGDLSYNAAKDWSIEHGWGLMNQPGPHNHFVAQLLTRMMMAEWNRPTAAGLAAAALISRTDYREPKERSLNRIKGEYWSLSAGWHPWVVETVLARIVHSYSKYAIKFPTAVPW